MTTAAAVRLNKISFDITSYYFKKFKVAGANTYWTLTIL